MRNAATVFALVYAASVAMAAPGKAHRPVIMMHGVSATAQEMATIEEMIGVKYPGTLVTSLALFEGNPDSWDHDLEEQIQGVIDAIHKTVGANPRAYEDGYDLICKSQGGLICRCVIEEMDDHNVSTFISLAGPQLGVFGQASFRFLPSWLANGTADDMYRVAYSSLGQKLSVGNMWRDFHHLEG